jgi:hypothetical protein
LRIEQTPRFYVQVPATAMDVQAAAAGKKDAVVLLLKR